MLMDIITSTWNVLVRASVIDHPVNVSVSMDMKAKVVQDLFVPTIALVMVDVTTSKTFRMVLLGTIGWIVPLRQLLCRLVLNRSSLIMPSPSITTYGISPSLESVYVMLLTGILIAPRDFVRMVLMF
jgi:hypothetical protein